MWIYAKASWLSKVTLLVLLKVWGCVCVHVCVCHRGGGVGHHEAGSRAEPMAEMRLKEALECTEVH